MNEMDLVRLNFNPQSLWALNFIIGLVMFVLLGVAAFLLARKGSQWELEEETPPETPSSPDASASET